MTKRGGGEPPATDDPEAGSAQVKAAMGQKRRVTLTVVEGGMPADGKPKGRSTRGRATAKAQPSGNSGELAEGKPQNDDHDEDAGAPPDDDGFGGNIPPVDRERVGECAELDQNDRDNGRRLIIWYGLDLAYVPGMGWLNFTGTHWLRDEGELQTRLHAQNVVDKIKLECMAIEPTPAVKRLIAAADAALSKAADAVTPADRMTIAKAQSARSKLAQKRQKRWNFAVSSGNAGKTAAMITQAASLKAVKTDDLDADLMQFNVRNGTLQFAKVDDPESDSEIPRKMGTVTFKPHERGDLITKCAEVDYDAEATCPEFLKFLEKVHPDPVMRRFMQVAHAYALLTGGNDEQILLFHYGTGANGKSVFIEALGRMAGGYRATVSPDTIAGTEERDGSKANSDIAKLHSARLVTIEELARGVQLKENLIKALTGGTRQVGRFNFKEFFEFDPIFTAIMSGNDMPTVSGTDYGIWRRLLIIEWGVTIPKEDRVAPSELAARFDAERAGILNWLIEGLMLYLKHGLVPYVPDSVTKFTEAYREERDPVGNFAVACVIADPERYVTAGAMYKAYTDYCEANAIKPYAQTGFGNRMNALGFKKERGSHVKYLGVRLGDIPSKFDPQQSLIDPGDLGGGTG